jgi:hypothetical protein
MILSSIPSSHTFLGFILDNGMTGYWTVQGNLELGSSGFEVGERRVGQTAGGLSCIRQGLKAKVAT